MAQHKQWPKNKLEFVHQHYEQIVKEVDKWLGDGALFIFGYLVRKFSENVLAEKLFEEEIWVTSFFDLILHVVKRTESNSNKGEQR